MLVKKLKSLTEMIYNHFHTHPKSMSLTEENKEDFKQATICHICENPFEKEDKKVRLLSFYW